MGWYEALKDAISAADKLRNAELNQKLANVQMECVKLAEDNANLRQELIELREKQKTRQDMEHRDNAYWRRLEGDKYEGPYCPKCLDGENKAARMSARDGDNYWRCPVCDLPILRPGYQY
jgi:DNA repair exonuclease SbcCD ATPase subunit